MFKIEKKELYWEGNYYNPTKTWYEWEETSYPLMDDEKLACEIAKEASKNPFALGFRVVNLDNKKVVKEY